MSRIPRDILSDSLAVLRIIEHEDEDNWPLDDKPTCKGSKHRLGNVPLNSQASYTNDDSACYYNYALGEGGVIRQQEYQMKTNSLPPASSINEKWDEIVCSALRISPEDIANQLTLLDLPCFQAIQPEELTTCGWNKLNKQTVAPNVVAFTKRFNRVSFWTVQEILNGQSPKARAETMAHFIKVAKKLYDVNNLHSLFAIICALRSASIYRLTKTWACLPKKDRHQFEKLAELFGEQDNWFTLREYLNAIPLPCIPYLGIFLTDVVYIDMAHAADSPARATKMALVLRALQRYQRSEYHIAHLPNVANYLASVRYIEELQKFLEDDHYKLSLKLEPPSPVDSCAGSKESIKEAVPPPGPSTLSPSHRLGSGSLRLHGNLHQSKFIPTHRKSRSLGSNIFGKSHTEDRARAEQRTPAGSVNLLDDTLLESPVAGSACARATAHSLAHNETSRSDMECDYQGFVRRKTILKDTRKVSFSAWQRYWMELNEDVLVFYASKSFKGSGRDSFRSEQCKSMSLDGWLAVRVDGDPADEFQLINHQIGTLYRFKTTSEAASKQWVAKIEAITQKKVQPLPTNLMSFE